MWNYRLFYWNIISSWSEYQPELKRLDRKKNAFFSNMVFYEKIELCFFQNLSDI